MATVTGCGDHRDQISNKRTVEQRLNCLKNIQVRQYSHELNFYQEFHALEMKYRQLFDPLFDKRAQIVAGLYEPTEEECQWHLDNNSKEEDYSGDSGDVKGIPCFWLTVFKNSELLSEMVQEYDEPILQHLMDVKIVFPDVTSMTFIIQFYFSPNAFFTNSILTKEYGVMCAIDKQDPLKFDGPEMFYCEGCEIHWKRGKNVTKVLQKLGRKPSFFNYFAPYYVPADNPIKRELLIMDFTIGFHFRGVIVQRAVSFFQGDNIFGEEEEEDEIVEQEVEEDERYEKNTNSDLTDLKRLSPFDCIER